MARFPAAFINNIADEGTKAEAIQFLQETWDELQSLRLCLIKRGFSYKQLDLMTRIYTHAGRVQ